MLLRSVLIASAAIALSVSSAAFAADADADPGTADAAAGTSVKFCGVVTKLTEEGCLGVPAGGDDQYEIGSSEEPPEPGTRVSGTGKVGDDDACGEGTPLVDVTWSEAASCP